MDYAHLFLPTIVGFQFFEVINKTVFTILQGITAKEVISFNQFIVIHISINAKAMYSVKNKEPAELDRIALFFPDKSTEDGAAVVLASMLEAGILTETWVETIGDDVVEAVVIVTVGTVVVVDVVVV